MEDHAVVDVFLGSGEVCPVVARVAEGAAKVAGDVDVGFIGDVFASFEDADGDAWIFSESVKS